MNYRRLGNSGLQVSAVSLGSWLNFGRSLERGEVREMVAVAIDAGINLFDTAENYVDGNAEALLGDVLADLRLSRDRFCISTKAFFGPGGAQLPTRRGLSRKHLRDACDRSLRQLRVDYLDLFLCHRPDPETPLEETVAAMDQLVRSGKVLYWGTSEWPAERILAAIRFADRNGLTPPSLEQSQYNLLWRERVEGEYAVLFEQHGLGLMAWSPLASGLLSGKYRDGQIPSQSRLAQYPQDSWRERLLGSQAAAIAQVVETLRQQAERLQTTPASLALAWCLQNEHVSSVILGCSSLRQLQENLQAVPLSGKLDAEVIGALSALGL